MFWQKIGNSVSDRLFRNSVIAENQCLYHNPADPILTVVYNTIIVCQPDMFQVFLAASTIEFWLIL